MEQHKGEQNVSRRNMLKTLGIGSGVAAVGLATQGGVAYAQPAGDSAQTILDVAVTAEALATTLIFGVITQSTYFAQLPAIHQDVFRATLSQEVEHYDALVAQGGKPAQTAFYMPEDLLSNLPLLVSVADFLETTCIGAYLAATRRFGELGMPIMSEIAAQFLGSESQHKALVRAMGREVLGIPLIPNNIPWERPTVYQVSQTQSILAPFLKGGSGFDRNFIGPMEVPARNLIDAVRLPLEPVPTADKAF